jgi:hypothetical protein
MSRVWDTVVMSACRKAALEGRMAVEIIIGRNQPLSVAEELAVFAEDPVASRAFAETKGLHLVYVDDDHIELNWGGRVSK